MRNLNINGIVSFLGENLSFSLEKGILTIEQSQIFIRKREELLRDKNLEFLKGYTVRNQSVIFFYPKYRDDIISLNPIFEVSSVFLTNASEVDENSDIKNVMLDGGVLNNFGDIYEDLFESSMDIKEIDKRDGAFEFRTRPFSETNFQFDPVDKNIKEVNIGLHRSSVINYRTLTEISRVINLDLNSGSRLKDVPLILSNIFIFLKLITWGKSIYVDQIVITLKSDRKIPVTGNFYIYDEKGEEEKINISIRDYFVNKVAISKLYTESIKLEKLQLYVLNQTHDKRFLSAKDVVESFISLEQLLWHYKLREEKITDEEAEMIIEIKEKYSKKSYSKIIEHLKFYKGNPIIDNAQSILKEDKILSNMLKNKFSKEADLSIDELVRIVGRFRNKVVHSSKFDIKVPGLASGTMMITYISYYLILKNSGYTPEESCVLVNKLFTNV